MRINPNTTSTVSNAPDTAATKRPAATTTMSRTRAACCSRLSISGAPAGSVVTAGSGVTAEVVTMAEVVGQFGSAKSTTPARAETSQAFTLGKQLPSESPRLGVSLEDVVDIARLTGLEPFDHAFEHGRNIDPSEAPV